MKRFWRENNLSIVVFVGFFLTFLVGQTLTGFHDYNDDREEHGRAPVEMTRVPADRPLRRSRLRELGERVPPDGLYVVLTVFLRPEGVVRVEEARAARSRSTRTPRGTERRRTRPWPVRRGGFVLELYEHSLALALPALSSLSFVAARGSAGAREYNEEQAGRTAASRGRRSAYLATSRFWFESFQNWQSEFLSVGIDGGCSRSSCGRRARRSPSPSTPRRRDRDGIGPAGRSNYRRFALGKRTLSGL